MSYLSLLNSFYLLSTIFALLINEVHEVRHHEVAIGQEENPDVVKVADEDQVFFHVFYLYFVVR